MARTTVPAVSATLAGAVATPSSPTVDGDIVPVGSRLLVINEDVTPVTVTVHVTATDTGLELPDAGGTVPVGEARLFGPFVSRLFAQPSDATEGPGAVLVDYGGSTAVTRVVFD